MEGDNNYQFDIIPTILKRRGIKDVDTYLNLSESVLEPLENYENMQKGADLLLKHIKNSNKMCILIDTDVDGLTSAAHIFLYIEDIAKELGVETNIKYFINKGKAHGIQLDDKRLKLKDIDLLIVPDAGSNDRDAIIECYRNNVEVLVLDHHQLEEVNALETDAVVINPYSSPKVINKNIAGVGVVHKFCKYIDKILGFNYADGYLDLVALGSIADLIDMREFETRYLVNKGLRNIQNEFIKELVDANSFMMSGHINPTTVGWNVSPCLNATIRVGKPKERLDMFEALIGVQKQIPYKTSKKDEIHNLQQTMARVCSNVKGRQDRAVKKSAKEIQDKIKSEGLDKNKMMVVDVTGILDVNYTGLVANKIASDYKRPVILLQEKRDNPRVFGGSGRNYSEFAVKDLKEYLLGTEFFNMCAGHDNAFGVEIERAKVSPFIAHINKDLEDTKEENHYEVDFEIPMHKLSTSIIKEVGKSRDLWGRGVQEPLFAITNVRVNSKDVELHGTRGKTIRFKKGDITFQRRFANEDLYEQFIMKKRRGMNLSKDLNYTIVGKLKVSEYEGKEYLQVDIVDYNVKEEDMIVF